MKKKASFLVFVLISLILSVFIGCDRSKEETAGSSKGDSTALLTPVPMPTPIHVELEFVEPADEPSVDFSSGAGRGQNFEELISQCRYAVYGTVQGINDVKVMFGDREGYEDAYYSVIDFKVKKELYAAEEIKYDHDDIIRIFYTLSSYATESGVPLVSEGDSMLILLNDTAANCHYIEMIEYAPYEAPDNETCFIRYNKDDGFDIEMLNELLIASGKEPLEVPCKSTEKLKTLFESHADGFRGLSWAEFLFEYYN